MSDAAAARSNQFRRKSENNFPSKTVSISVQHADGASSDASLRGIGATMTIDSPTDGDVFLAYLEPGLCPKLQTVDVVVMDNLSAHKVNCVREWIEAREPTCSTYHHTHPPSTRSRRLGRSLSSCCVPPEPARRKPWKAPSPST